MVMAPEESHHCRKLALNLILWMCKIIFRLYINMCRALCAGMFLVSFGCNGTRGSKLPPPSPGRYAQNRDKNIDSNFLFGPVGLSLR